MKKIITVLAILVVLVGAVFAATGDKVTLESKVSKVTPAFKIYSKNDTTGATLVDTDMDISATPIEWYFTIKQDGGIRVKDSATVAGYSKFKGALTIEVALSPFKATVNDVPVTSAQNPTISREGTDPAVSAKAVTDKVTVTSYGVKTGTTNTAEIKLNYLGKKLTNTEANAVATVYGTWPQDDTLPVDGDSTTYTADITLTYTPD